MAAAPKAAPLQNDMGGGSNSRPAEGSVSFVRGSGRGRYTFEVQSGITLQSTAQDIGPIDIKAYDYMRSLTLLVQTTTAGAGTATSTYAADGPFNALTYIRVNQPNGQTMYYVSSGFHATMIHKYGQYRAHNDPYSNPNFVQTAGTTPTFTFAIRIPFELDLRDALGALPNKDAAAPFTLQFGVNTLANVFGTAPGTSPTIKVTPILEAYDQPPETLDGKGVDTTPPNMNSLQRWTEQNVTMVSGQFDMRVRKLGNYVRELIFISKNSSGARIDTNGWADPVQVVLDEDVKDNLPQALWEQDIYEVWGYGGAAAGNNAPTARADQAGAQNIGVWPYNYFCNERNPYDEEVGFYLPTIESEDYLLRGSWGSAVSKMTVLKCEVLPRGDIFGES